MIRKLWPVLLAVLAACSQEGAAGPAGPEGPQGLQGQAGPQGSQGVAGLQGVAGPQGDPGAQGPAGPQGPQGVAGPQGPAGAVGPQGPAGPQGSRGATWVGGWSEVVRYEIDDAVSYEGSSYVAVERPVPGLAPPSGTAWQLVASRGEVGPQGPQGDVGPQGPPGLGQVLSIETGAGLTGGPITTTGTISIAAAGVTNAMLQSDSVTVTAGPGLSGGGSVALGGSVTLSAADLGGDVSGTPGTAVVTALQGNPVAAGTPSNGQFLVWSTSANAWVPLTVVVPRSATYRWAVFDTYDQSSGWMANNDPALYGGVPPSTWTDGNGLAYQMSADKEVLRTLFTRKGWARANALVNSETSYIYSSTNGKVTAALFRIRNTTGSAIDWSPSVRVTSYPAWGEMASVALNGANVWNSGGTTYAPTSGPVSLTLSIPPNRTSTAIFVSPSGPAGPPVRTTLLAFVGNSLALPVGLEFIDDLDTAAGGWEQ